MLRGCVSAFRVCLCFTVPQRPTRPERPLAYWSRFASFRAVTDTRPPEKTELYNGTLYDGPARRGKSGRLLATSLTGHLVEASPPQRRESFWEQRRR